jgi:hypothetical protein
MCPATGAEKAKTGSGSTCAYSAALSWPARAKPKT